MFVQQNPEIMKKNWIGFFVLIISLISCTTSDSSHVERTITSKTINGETVATVTTTDNGITTTKTYKGKEADQFLKENNSDIVPIETVEPVKIPDMDLPESESRMVKMENVNGKKTLTIEEEKNGKTVKSVYYGSEADRKLRELKAEK